MLRGTTTEAGRRRSDACAGQSASRGMLNAPSSNVAFPFESDATVRPAAVWRTSLSTLRGIRVEAPCPRPGYRSATFVVPSALTIPQAVVTQLAGTVRAGTQLTPAEAHRASDGRSDAGAPSNESTRPSCRPATREARREECRDSRCPPTRWPHARRRRAGSRTLRLLAAPVHIIAHRRRPVSHDPQFCGSRTCSEQNPNVAFSSANAP